MMMRMHGLSNIVYVFIMYLYFIIQYTLYIIVMIGAGVMARLQFFRRNTLGECPHIHACASQHPCFCCLQLPAGSTICASCSVSGRPINVVLLGCSAALQFLLSSRVLRFSMAA